MWGVGGCECVWVVVNVRVWGYGWLSVGMWVVVSGWVGGCEWVSGWVVVSVRLWR